MPLQFTKVTLPTTGGLNQMASKFVRPAAGEGASLTVAENVVYRRAGVVTKRGGFEKLPMTTDVWSIDGARNLSSSGPSLTLVDKRRAWRFAPTLGTSGLWQDRGPVAPGGLKYGLGISGGRSYNDASAHSNGTHTIIASAARWTAVDPAATSVDSYGVRVLVASDDGVVVLRPQDMLVTTTAADSLNSIHCCSVGDSDMLMLGTRGTGVGGSGRVLEVRKWQTSAPYTVPQLVYSVSNVKDITRGYDVIRRANGNCLIAWISEALGTVHLHEIDSSTTLVASTTIATTADAQGVAICETVDNDIMVLVSIETSPVEVVLYQRDTDLLASYGPIAQATALASDEDGQPEEIAYLGIVTHGTKFCASFNRTNAGSSKSRITYIGGDVSDGSKTFEEAIQNCSVHTRPWVHDSRFYVAGATYQNRYPYDCGIIFELYPNTQNPLMFSRQPTLVGAYHMGIADRVRGARSAAGVSNATNSAMWLAFRYTAGEPDFAVNSNSVGEAKTNSRVGVEAVTLDYSAPFVTTQTADNEQIVGGSLVNYLGGGVTQELGFIVPPILRNDHLLGTLTEDEDASASPGKSADTYSFSAIWSWLDTAGVLHRSAPNVPVSLVVSAPSAGQFRFVRLRAKTNGATNRLNDGDVTVEWYSADATAVSRRIDTEHTPNNDTSYETVPLVDYGQSEATSEDGLGDPLYTTGGVLENVAPAGADVVAVIGDRLWVGGRKRLQYSKPLLPGNVSQYRVAPELSDGFLLQLPNGEPCTGIGELDDRAVIFTPRQVLAVNGGGPDNLGAGGSFELGSISADGGCTDPRSVVSYNEGVFYQGPRGIYQLTRGLEVQFIGKDVVDITDAYPVVTSAVLADVDNEVRFTVTNAAGTDGRILVWNYLVRDWTVWIVKDASGDAIPMVGGCMHNGVYHVLDSGGEVHRHTPATHLDDGRWYPLKARSSWFQGAGMNGWQSIRNVAMLARAGGAHGLKMRIYHDFSDTASQEYAWPEMAVSSWGNTSEKEVAILKPRYQRCSAISVEIEDTAPATLGTGAGVELSGWTLDVGLKRGVNKVSRKQR